MYTDIPGAERAADRVRRTVVESVFRPARAAGKATVTVRAGDLHRALGWSNRVPSVCSALDSAKLRRQANVRVLERRGPAQSTTTEWVFALDPPGPGRAAPATPALATERIVAEWDGTGFRPVRAPQLAPGTRVLLTVSPQPGAREAAGRFGAWVGTLSPGEAQEVQAAMDGAFGGISDDW